MIFKTNLIDYFETYIILNFCFIFSNLIIILKHVLYIYIYIYIYIYF